MLGQLNAHLLAENASLQGGGLCLSVDGDAGEETQIKHEALWADCGPQAMATASRDERYGPVYGPSNLNICQHWKLKNSLRTLWAS